MSVAHDAKYDPGMTTRITISLPDEAVTAAKAAVKSGHATSVSAYVANALARTYGQRPLVALLAELKQAHGEPTAAERRWAEEALGMA
jgi:Arc/MetJ-type ribon-helix-helix transcriptional regulator